MREREGEKEKNSGSWRIPNIIKYFLSMHLVSCNDF